MADVSARPLTAQDVATLEALVGEDVPVTARPHVEYATVDTVRAFARGYGDDNPRHGDEMHPGGMVAPPLFPIASGVGTPTDERAAARLHAALAGATVRVGAERWRLFADVRLGMRLERRDTIAAVVRGPEHDGAPTVTVTIRSSYVADGACLAERERDRTHGAAPMDAPGTAARTRHVYTDEELAAIDAEYAAQRRRGTSPLLLRDVAVGDVLEPIVKGPLTVTDLVAYRAGVGAGPFDVEPLRLAYLNRLARPGFYDRDASGAWDARERLHWDDDYARRCGHPGAYDYSHTRLNWAVHLLGDRTGDAARLRTIGFVYEHHNYVGDTHRLGATVTAIDAASAQVHLAWHATNQLGVRTCHGDAVVQLAG